jgi:hypothetical protein
MRRAGSIVFLSLYMLAFTELHELVLIPVLMEHFREHRSENDGMSFVEFLAYHYFSSHGSEDTSSHEKLPFNHAHAKIMNLALSVTPPVVDSEKEPYADQVHSSYNDPFTSDFAQNNIWQPPKQV